MEAKIKGVFYSMVVMLLMTAGVSHAQELDSTVRVALDKKLSEYFAAIEREGTDVQKGECDFLIGTCTDSLMRQHVTLSIYDHYRDSKVMGSEAVAIHVFDKWILPGKVRMRSEAEMMAARVFAEFNRQSLIGNKAPELVLYNADGEPVTVFGDSAPKRFSVLYFYDSSCATCKVQSILLRHLFQGEDYPVDFYAVYAAGDREKWLEYVGDQLTFDSRQTRVFHLWDPEISSDFQRKYGVIQTPRMFLVSPDGIILGRGLDAQALSLMLDVLFGEVEMEYGSDESVSLYDGIFAGDDTSADDVKAVADYISSSTLEKGDTLMFKQMTGDMLYYLALQKGAGFKEGMASLVEEKILSKPEIWKSADDSLKVVGMAMMYQDLLSRSTPGKPVPDMKLPGILLSKGKEKNGVFRLRKLRGAENYIMFVTDGCQVCAAEKEAAREMSRLNRKARFLLVNVDDILAADPVLSNRMFDSFDLSVLPFILKTEKKGRISERYLSIR